VRLPCTDCPKTFRTSTGLEWHREHNHQVQELPTPDEPPDAAAPVHKDIEQQPAPSTVTVVWNTNSGTYEVEKPSVLASPVPPIPQVEAPTKPGDYNCLDCRGANHLGGFFLRAAVNHHRQTGHRLEHIPGSFEAGLAQLNSFQFLPGPSVLAARTWFSRSTDSR